ncbi:uncharacterized protein MELLADRAFT_85134 [Melampsora larici-populina 98AG31]|uniref:Glycogen debranching enzyme glucanotransferase domain-containing protein n=1 Tax=Melampsora larici-populina (strain 98AG31 / pathotype 3-4-7) TaxID=747676 RepID=F4RHL9_MELLP|nr:uncharacterized protein MELLADRAFT_85134 [Melampsora larici-populina 98AG31]EGG08113.1 hypothetical protein MELLADRAFT_85134 [Melampsora larici-populina 98AG31]
MMTAAILIKKEESKADQTSQDHSVQVLPFGKTGETIDRNAPLVNLPLNGLAIQSMIAKCYNVIHFTPLQQHGESGSPYNIFDQLLLNGIYRII